MAQTFSRLFDVFYYQQEKYPLEVALAEKVKGTWVTYSTQEVLTQTNRISRGLYRLGLRPGDMVSIISANRPIWNMVDLAAQQIGCVVVPIYPNISIADYLFILNDCEARAVFVQDKGLYNKIIALQPDLPKLEFIFCFAEVEGIPHWTEVLVGEAEVDHKIVENIMAGISPMDLATIIYTSGTTGTPKGVMLSHNNLVSNAVEAAGVMPVETYMRVLSSLPICHVFERMVCYLFMYKGMSIYYAERVESIAENLKEVKPHFFSTVPRLLEKMYEKIISKGDNLTGVKKKLFDWSLKLADKYEIDKNQGIWYETQLALARKLVFSKWREAVGGEVVGIVSGAAALQPRLIKIFNAAGIAVREGYGQTETSPVISVSLFDKGDSRIGTVGPPLPGVTLKIAEDGEICVKGPNVMMGYYKRPDLTSQTIDAEGWLHTGDVGTLVEGRYLKITDRKKELFKTSGGKYIAPQVIENAFKESFFIDQIMVVGENRKTISALIVPALPSLQAWCEQQGIAFSNKAEMMNHPQVIKKYAQIRDEINRRFSDVEKVKRFVLLPDAWTVDSGEMTPTLKIKRKVVYEKYRNQIAELYNED